MNDIIKRPKDFKKFLKKTEKVDVLKCINEADHGTLAILIQYGFTKDEAQYLNTLHRLSVYVGWSPLWQLTGRLREISIEIEEKMFPNVSRHTNRDFGYMDGKYYWTTWEESHHNGNIYDRKSGALPWFEARKNIWDVFEGRALNRALEKAEKDLMEEQKKAYLKEKVLRWDHSKKD